jgi:ribosome-binding factor A
MSRRTERLADLLREELSQLLLREMKDPRLAHGLVTITEVQVAPDLHNATVYVSHLGDEVDRDEVLRALTSASHFLHGELTKRLSLRRVPDLHFRFDPTIERGARLAALINAVSAPPPDED